MRFNGSWLKTGWVATAFLAAAVLLLVVYSGRSQSEADRLVTHTVVVQRALHAAEASIDDVHAMILRYALVGNVSEIAEFKQEVGEAQDDLKELRRTMQDNPAGLATAAAVTGAFTRVANSWNGVIAAGHTGWFSSLGGQLASSANENALKDIHRRIDGMLESQHQLLLARTARVKWLRKVTFWTQIIVGGMLVLQLVASYWLVQARQVAMEREKSVLDQARRLDESIVATVRQPLMVLDADLRVVSANRTYQRVFRVTPAEVEGRPLTDLAGGAWNVPTLIDRLNAVIADHANLDAFRVEHNFPGMGRRILVLNATKIFRPGYSADRILLAIEDDTDRQTAEAELRALNAELESFAYSVAHDLRAPLRAMQGFGEILTEDYGERLDDKGRDYLSRISTAAARMNEMIGDLLDYSRLAREQIDIAPVALGEVVAAAQQQLAEDLTARQAEITVAAALPTVLGHQATLVQVVANLLTNAAKFVAPGGRPRIEVGAEERQGMVRFWIKDNGIGIAPEFHQRIFRVFERLHGQESYPGTGVGLAIVAKAAERMGGRAGVESALGAGSCFWIEMHPADPQII